jgi:membrane fusion protein, macrolide-specific efflux system
MKKKIVLILCVLIFAGGGVMWKMKQKSKAKKSNDIQSVVATNGDIEETLDATGDVSPLNRVEIKPPISGRVEKLLVDEGATVKSGDVLAWISSSDRAAILDAARAQGAEQYKYWQDAYKATPILAPLSGVIILRNVVVGQTVDASNVLFAMSDKLIVLAQVDEADIGRVQVGMSARITLDAYPNQPIDGRVFQILNEGKNVSNVITYGVKIEPKTVPSFFRSQMTANTNLIVQRKENAVLIPSAAVQEAKNGEPHVLVPGEKGKPTSKTIEVGINNGQNAEVLSGLNAGDTILIATKKYSPQKGPQSSPLSLGGARGQQGTGGRNRR